MLEHNGAIVICCFSHLSRSHAVVTRARRQPMSIAHNKGETPFFAASIERAAKRNWSPAESFPPELGVRRVAAGLRQ